MTIYWEKALQGDSSRTGATRIPEKIRTSMIFSVLLLLPMVARALNPDRTISQYVHTAWRIQEAAVDKSDRARGRAMLDKALDRADEVIADGRDKVQVLRVEALNVIDLSQSLEAYARERAQEHSMTFSLTEEGNKRKLDPLVRDEIFRVGREALANAFDHSGGTHVSVSLHFDRREFRIIVVDDGVGISPKVIAEGRPEQWGLAGMRERARYVRGTIEIASDPQVGTTITVRVPRKVVYPSKFRHMIRNLTIRKADRERL